MFRRISSVTLMILVAIAAGCSDESSPLTVDPSFDHRGPNPNQAQFAEAVAFYYGPGHGENECATAAVQLRDGLYQFPAGHGYGAGSSACLTATVLPSGGSHIGGWVFWEVCKNGNGEIQSRAYCANDPTGWTPIPNQGWTAVDSNGQNMTASHSSLACNQAQITGGYRYLYSPVDPATSSAGTKFAVATDAFDVISDGTILPDFTPCP